MGRVFRFTKCKGCIRIRRITEDQSRECYLCKPPKSKSRRWWLGMPLVRMVGLVVVIVVSVLAIVRAIV